MHVLRNVPSAWIHEREIYWPKEMGRKKVSKRHVICGWQSLKSDPLIFRNPYLTTNFWKIHQFSKADQF